MHPWASAEIFPGGERPNFAHPFQVADDQTRNHLGTAGGAKSFLRGIQVFKLCSAVSNYVQNIFPGGLEFFQGSFAPLLPPGYGPADDAMQTDVHKRLYVF